MAKQPKPAKPNLHEKPSASGKTIVARTETPKVKASSEKKSSTIQEFSPVSAELVPSKSDLSETKATDLSKSPQDSQQKDSPAGTRIVRKYPMAGRQFDIVRPHPKKITPIILVEAPKYTGMPGFFKKWVNHDEFADKYLLISLFVLFFSTLYWSILGANLHRGNADHLINSYLFDNARAFHGSLLPAQHSFLLKWPIFWIIHIFGSTTTTIAATTVVLCLLTVGALATILYKIDKRHLVFGTYCLALSSVLLLVPPMPYPGGILPVNMAMVATRNIEYIVYILSVYLIISGKILKGRRFWGGVVLLGILTASDKLFVSLSAGAGVIGLLVYLLLKKRELSRFNLKWLLAIVAANLGATAILWWLNTAQVIHLVSSGAVGPYSLVKSAKDLALGLLYGGLGILTNFGANPAFAATRVSDIGHTALRQVMSLTGVAYVVNLVVFIYVLLASFKLVTKYAIRRSAVKADESTTLSLTLIWTALVATGVFVISKHYYAVDARYLTITFFALFIASATYTRSKDVRIGRLLTVSAALAISIALGSFMGFITYATNQKALKDINARNALIAQVLSQHRVDTLVGDYWRVTPTKLESNNRVEILPLQNCTEPRGVLNSGEWGVDLHKKSFAYILSLDQSLTDFPPCTADQVTGFFGQPETSAVISGNLENPKELLLFYDHGMTQKKTIGDGSSSLLPVSPDQLPFTYCKTSTVMNIVAHEDDDLLFLSPDLINTIKSGACVRTIYLTAGDAGSDKFYWLSREQGAKAAYDQMLGASTGWVQHVVKLGEKNFATVNNPRGNPNITLIFMHLPDGNMRGEGFKRYKFENLEALKRHKIGRIKSVDGESSYDHDQLTSALTDWMRLFKPSEIRGQSPLLGGDFRDHSDHLAASYFADEAYKKYLAEGNQTSKKNYLGYPVREKVANIYGADLAAKEAAFFTYAKFDPSVCKSRELCKNIQTYSGYLQRQYHFPE